MLCQEVARLILICFLLDLFGLQIARLMLLNFFAEEILFGICSTEIFFRLTVLLFVNRFGELYIIRRGHGTQFAGIFLSQH